MDDEEYWPSSDPDDDAPDTRHVCSTVTNAALTKIFICSCALGFGLLQWLGMLGNLEQGIPAMLCVTVGVDLMLGVVGIISLTRNKQRPVPLSTCWRGSGHGCVDILPWSMASLDAWLLFVSLVTLGSTVQDISRAQAANLGLIAMTCAVSMANALVTVVFAGIWLRRSEAQLSKDEVPARAAGDSHSYSAKLNDFRASLARDSQQFEAAYCIAEVIFIFAYVIYMQLPHYDDNSSFYLKAKRMYKVHITIAPLCLFVRVYRCVRVTRSYGMDMLSTLLDAVCFTWLAILAGSVWRIAKTTLVFNIMLSYMLIFVFPFRRALTVVSLSYLTYCATSAITICHQTDRLQLRNTEWGHVIADLGALGIGLLLSISAKRTIELSKWDVFVLLRDKAAEAIHEKVLRVEAEFAHESVVKNTQRSTRTTQPSEGSDRCKEVASGSSTCGAMLPSLLSAPAILQTASAATKACPQRNSCSGGDCLPPDAKVWVEGYTCPRPLGHCKRGERVLCYDRLSGNLKYADITAFELTEGSTNWSIVSLTDGTTLKMTSDHPMQRNATGSKNTAIDQLAPVRAQDLQPQRDSLTVLKVESVPVAAVQHVKQVGQKISLSVQQPLRHSIFVAAQGGTGNGGTGPLQTMCVESADVVSQGRLAPGERRTFVHLTEDVSESDMPPRRRTSSEPPGSPRYLPGQDLDHCAVAALAPCGDVESQCQTTSNESCSATGSQTGSQNAEVLIAGALTLAPVPQETEHGPLFVMPAGANAPARLSDLLRVKESGFRSLGSVDHGTGKCQPCAFHNRCRPSGAMLVCNKGLLCERCHQDHQGTMRQQKRQLARQLRVKPAGTNPEVLVDVQTAAPAPAAAAAAPSG